MTLRSLMSAACSPSTVAYTPECSGSVVLTPELIAMDRDDLLDEARVGCSQKCGCLSAMAEVVEECGVLVLKARCCTDPSVLALGDRKPVPEPDVPRRMR